MPRWQACMKIMQELWGSSLQSGPLTSLVCGNTNKYRNGYYLHLRISFFTCLVKKYDSRTAISTVFIVVHLITKWSSSQGIYIYLAGSTDFGNLSFIVPGMHPFFYICTDAFNHTEEYAEAAGTAALGGEVVSCDEIGLYCDQTISDIFIFPGHMVCLWSFYLLRCFISPLCSFPCARSWRGPVVHPEDSQSSGYDSCRCRVLPCSAEASEGGLPPGQAEAGEITQRQQYSPDGSTNTIALIIIIGILI